MSDSGIFAFQAASDEGEVVGALYTYTGKDGSTTKSGMCTANGGLYYIDMSSLTGGDTGTGVPRLEIRLLVEEAGEPVVVQVVANPNEHVTDSASGIFAPDGIEAAPGEQVTFEEITADEGYEVTEVYATYNKYAEDGATTYPQYISVDYVGGHYTFQLPKAEAFGNCPPNMYMVRVNIVTESTAPQETSVELELDGGSGAGAGGTETYRGGDVLSATATVYDADNNPLTGHAGAVVTFVMPNGEVVNGFLESDGTARATWVVPHDFAESHENGTVQANFAGDGDYAKSDAASETVNFESTAIKPAAGAAITATAEGIGAGTVLTVGQTAVLGLSEDAVLVNGEAIDTAGYTCWSRAPSSRPQAGER